MAAACDGPSVPLRVAAASDLHAAFTELAQRFEQSGHGKVDVTFGASGVLAKQIEHGAPFDVFAAANLGFVDDVVAAGACEQDSARAYARGHLILWSREKRTLASLTDDSVKHIAIANPETAPYGRAAKQALVAAGLWQQVESKIVYGGNVQQTLQLAQTNNADVALVSRSLVSHDVAHTTAIDEALHAPLMQGLVVCKRGARKDAGARFVELVLSDEGRALLSRYGFDVP